MCIISGAIALGSTFAAVGAALASSVGATAVSTATATTIGITAAVAADLAITGALAGGVLGTIGAVQQAEQEEAQANFYAEQEEENARLARREAEAIEVMGNQEKNKLRLQMLDQKASGRVSYASGGVVLGHGTTLDYEADIADAYDLDSRNLEYDIESRKWQKKVAAINASDQARMYRSQAEGYSRQRTTSLLSGIFKTVGDTASTTLSAFSALDKLGAFPQAGAGYMPGAANNVGIVKRPSKIGNMA